MRDFPCDSCGGCCKRIGHLQELAGYADENGVCKHLTDDNKCSIYENRPKFCDTRVHYFRHFRDKMTWDQYIKMSEKACEELRNAT